MMKLLDIMEDGSLWANIHDAMTSWIIQYINVDCTFLEDGLTDHDETFRDYGVWPRMFEYP